MEGEDRLFPSKRLQSSTSDKQGDHMSRLPTVPADACCPSLIINGTSPLHCQKCPGLDDKLYVHFSDKTPEQNNYYLAVVNSSDANRLLGVLSGERAGKTLGRGGGSGRPQRWDGGCPGLGCSRLTMRMETADRHSVSCHPTTSIFPEKSALYHIQYGKKNAGGLFIWLDDSTNFTGLFGVGMENTGRWNEHLKARKLKISKLINHSSQQQLL